MLVLFVPSHSVHVLHLVGFTVHQRVKHPCGILFKEWHIVAPWRGEEMRTFRTSSPLSSALTVSRRNIGAQFEAALGPAYEANMRSKCFGYGCKVPMAAPAWRRAMGRRPSVQGLGHEEPN